MPKKLFAQRTETVCNVCGKPDELASNCPLKKESEMKNWYISNGKVLFYKNICQNTSDPEGGHSVSQYFQQLDLEDETKEEDVDDEIFHRKWDDHCFKVYAR